MALLGPPPEQPGHAAAGGRFGQPRSMALSPSSSPSPCVRCLSSVNSMRHLHGYFGIGRGEFRLERASTGGHTHHRFHELSPPHRAGFHWRLVGDSLIDAMHRNVLRGGRQGRRRLLASGETARASVLVAPLLHDAARDIRTGLITTKALVDHLLPPFGDAPYFQARTSRSMTSTSVLCPWRPNPRLPRSTVIPVATSPHHHAIPSWCELTMVTPM